ncbi:MAG: LLM class F420-dependent oxidoreductase [Alphaproteobacteria bacterium]
MRLGVVFPQTEIGTDPAAVRDYAQAAESLGYDHLLAYDHVLGANAATHKLNGPYKHTDMFHEPFVLYGYLAAVTQKLELVTAIIILPQRQTALVAKQAAAVDILSGGRLRLGIANGWNHVEYEALGMNFHDRGRRLEEQVAVMRLLWTKDLVTFDGKWHKIADAGLNPLPVQKPIPIWFGGHADAALRRVARLGDGWFPLFAPDDKGRGKIEQLHAYAREAGRQPGSIGIESWVNIGGKSPESWADEVSRWREFGATHISVNTMNAGMSSLADHIDAVKRFKEAVTGI